MFQDENGNKMVNEYVRECKIGAGSYGKVVSIILMTLLFISLLQQILFASVLLFLYEFSLNVI